MELLPFQAAASAQIAERFRAYVQDPLAVRLTQLVPFIRILQPSRAPAKRLILADAVEQIRSQVPLEPIVLWLSKGRMVVWQTFANFPPENTPVSLAVST
jgi:type III restriction enzyme